MIFLNDINEDDEVLILCEEDGYITDIPEDIATGHGRMIVAEWNSVTQIATDYRPEILERGPPQDFKCSEEEFKNRMIYL